MSEDLSNDLAHIETKAETKTKGTRAAAAKKTAATTNKQQTVAHININFKIHVTVFAFVCGGAVWRGENAKNVRRLQTKE